VNTRSLQCVTKSSSAEHGLYRRQHTAFGVSSDENLMVSSPSDSVTLVEGIQQAEPISAARSQRFRLPGKFPQRTAFERRKSENFCLSCSQLKGLLREEHQRTEDDRGDILHKRDVLTKGAKTASRGAHPFLVTKKPNMTTEARYRAAANAKHAIDFHCCAAAPNSRLA